MKVAVMHKTRTPALSSFVIVLCAFALTDAATSAEPALLSIDTGYTIMKVRSAEANDKTFIVGSSYEGAVMGVGYDGTMLWTNPVSGYMTHDLWCEDITGDGSDEILVANADGAVYCLNAVGSELWRFKPNSSEHLPPMYAVCVIRDDTSTPYVVCGGFDQSYYYVSAEGMLIKEIKSSTYSTLKTWGKSKEDLPPDNRHTINFLRTLPQPDGSEVLVVHATNNHMQVVGVIYQFRPLAEKPFSANNVEAPTVIGELRVCDPDADGNHEILLGTSGLGDQAMVRFNPADGEMDEYRLAKIGDSGYRVTQAVTIPDGNSFVYFMICGTHVVLVSPALDRASEEMIAGRYAYNDMWKDPADRILLASSQSGGSCIHVIDPKQSGWKAAFSNLTPPGKIETILANTESVRKSLASFQQPAWQRSPLPVYLTWANKSDPATEGLIENLIAEYDSPVFLNKSGSDKENWDRSGMANEKYREKRDRRMKYVLTQQEVLDELLPDYEDGPGIAYWVGHGNDPYMYSLDTTKKVLDGAKGKKTVLILPELGDTSEDLAYVMEDLFYPLANYAAQKNGIIFFRSKNIFWQGDIYLPMWHEVLSGKHAKSVVPSMEETTDKTMELSLVGRMGLWASGAVDSWGMRCSRDNPSFDRCRQHSYQRLPNHFLRTIVYSLASGSQYLNNTYVDQQYMSLAWELVAKGALYVPKREEIVSFSPVHVSMKEPDEHYLRDGTNHKWTTFYDREFEENNPFVFSRMNATWPGAPVTEWDFSRYAAGVKDRRQNFLPPYSNGTVLITPVQHGVFADKNAPRGALADYLHPLYKNIMREYITDGRYYYSADGKHTFAADEYSRAVEAEIEARSRLLPLTVSGDVAWVAAQTSPTHLRLTLVDSGYINPKARSATARFHTIQPVKMVDLLDGTEFDTTDPSSINVAVPCGMFRFIDIELKDTL